MAEKALLLDMEKCIACRACQVACKQWNELPGEKTTFFAAAGGYQNPIGLSPSTYTLVKFYEVEQQDKLRWLFRVHRCMQCVDPACVKACPVSPKAMTRDENTGAVHVNRERCIGCGACREYCPFTVPVIDTEAGKSTKCTFCFDRQAEGIEPACAKACPTDCQVFGDRADILKMAHHAHQRLVGKGRNPVIYGEKELGTGTKKIYVLPEPLDLYPDVPKNPKVSEDLGFFHQMLKPLGALTLTASVVGMVLARMKEVKEKDKVKPS
ncbi:MAG: 4Fe-4S dicluster domain-containing protein [Candidatus Zixiibacteriota bacterium]|nr:MAG: 4Fe-4S dicluster domain-containing protein [candidate division Zixibacteria bacterium]